MTQRMKNASDIQAGDRIPSNHGTFTVNQVEKRGSKILAFTDEKLPDDTYCIQFGWTEIVAVDEPNS